MPAETSVLEPDTGRDGRPRETPEDRVQSDPTCWNCGGPYKTATKLTAGFISQAAHDLAPWNHRGDFRWCFACEVGE